MKHALKPLLAATLAAGLAMPATSFATNGMFMIGYGTKSRGMGGVSIATTLDSLAGATNPAAIRAFNTRVDVGMDYFRPMATAALGIGTRSYIEEESQADSFLIPNMGGAMRFNRKLSFGFSAVGAGGGGSRYNRNIYNAQRAGADISDTLGVNMMVMQMNPTVAFRASKNHSVGASLIIGVQTFRAFGLTEFNAFTPSGGEGKTSPYLTNNGNDWAYGAGVRVGWLGKFLKKKLTLGASASSKVYMTKFEKYKELFAGSGSFDTPPQFGFGAAYKATKKLTVAMDVAYTMYSAIPSIANRGPNTPADEDPTPLGGDESRRLGLKNGMGFDWDDQIIFKLGANYDFNKQWSLRAGWNYAKSPIPEERAIIFNIVAPATTQNHATIGGSYRPNRNMELSFSYVHAFKYSQRGPTYIGSQGEISMYQDSVGASFAYYF